MVTIHRDGRIKVIGGDNIEAILSSPKQLPFKNLEVCCCILAHFLVCWEAIITFSFKVLVTNCIALI